MWVSVQPPAAAQESVVGVAVAGVGATAELGPVEAPVEGHLPGQHDFLQYTFM